MRELLEIFKKQQIESNRLRVATAERRTRAITTSKYKLVLLRSTALALNPNALDIRELVGYCVSVEDYLFITYLFFKTGHKEHLEIIYQTLLQKLDRTQDLVKIGKQMIVYGFSQGYDFIIKANSCVSNVYERILVQETMEEVKPYYGNVA